MCVCNVCVCNVSREVHKNTGHGPCLWKQGLADLGDWRLDWGEGKIIFTLLPLLWSELFHCFLVTIGVLWKSRFFFKAKKKTNAHEASPLSLILDRDCLRSCAPWTLKSVLAAPVLCAPIISVSMTVLLSSDLSTTDGLGLAFLQDRARSPHSHAAPPSATPCFSYWIFQLFT